MTAAELMIRLRERDEFDNVLEDVVIVEGAGGPSTGGACPGFVFIGGRFPGGTLGQIRDLVNEWAGEEVVIHRVKASL